MDSNNERIVLYKDKYYTIFKETNTKRYILNWRTSLGEQECEITEEIYQCFIGFKKEDKSISNWDSRHLERSELREITLNNRAIHKAETVEEAIFDNESTIEILDRITELTEIQKRRFLLNYNGFSMSEIAKLEKCSRRSVNYSIGQAIEIIKNFYKNF